MFITLDDMDHPIQITGTVQPYHYTNFIWRIFTHVIQLLIYHIL